MKTILILKEIAFINTLHEKEWKIWAFDLLAVMYIT